MLFIIDHVEGNHSRSLLVQRSRPSNVSPGCPKLPQMLGNFGRQYFSFSLYQILCHSILIWKISYYKTRPVICYHPFPPPCYVWDAANMHTQKVSKVPPFDGSDNCKENQSSANRPNETFKEANFLSISINVGLIAFRDIYGLINLLCVCWYIRSSHMLPSLWQMLLMKIEKIFYIQ